MNAESSLCLHTISYRWLWFLPNQTWEKAQQWRNLYCPIWVKRLLEGILPIQYVRDSEQRHQQSDTVEKTCNIADKKEDKHDACAQETAKLTHDARVANRKSVVLWKHRKSQLWHLWVHKVDWTSKSPSIRCARHASQIRDQHGGSLDQ